MKFLLVVVLFSLNPDTSMKGEGVFTVPFATLEQCNVAGQNLRTIVPQIPSHVKSITTCVSAEAFNEKVL